MSSRSFMRMFPGKNGVRSCNPAPSISVVPNTMGTDHVSLLYFGTSRRSQRVESMPRRARIVAAGFPLHVILRGIDRSVVFFDEDNHRFFLGCLRAAAPTRSSPPTRSTLSSRHPKRRAAEPIAGCSMTSLARTLCSGCVSAPRWFRTRQR